MNIIETIEFDACKIRRLKQAKQCVFHTMTSGAITVQDQCRPLQKILFPKNLYKGIKIKHFALQTEVLLNAKL